MAERRGARLTRLEHEVMEVLWRLERASVREIHEALPDSKRGAYTTIQTIVARLEEKGAVRRVRKIGNAFIFEAAVTRASARVRLVDEVLEQVGGARPLMAHLVETGEVSLEDLRELEELVRRLGREARGGKSR
jgi:BlaI family transcriptional regulator, penicillinase repressor